MHADAIRGQAPYALLAGIASLPFILPVHRPPLATFYPEWLAAALLVALTFSVAFMSRTAPRGVVPGAAWAAAALLAWGIARTIALPPAFWQEPVIFFLGLGAGILAATLGATLVRHVGIHRVMLVLSIGVLAAAVFNVFAAVLQQLHLDRQIDWLVFNTSLYGRPVGNIAQPNMLADYLGIGLASLAYLFLARQITLAPAACIMLVLLYGGELAGSRTWSLILLASLASLVAFAFLSRARTWRRRAWHMAALVVGAWCVLQFAIWAVAALGWAPSMASHSLARLLATGANDFQRYDLWRAAIEMATLFPWTGVGIAQYDTGFFNHVTGNRPLPVPTAPEHAHNFYLNILAEQGIPGLLIVVAASFAIIRTCRWNRDPAALAATMALASMVIHSMLEYPLWYVSFLILFGLYCGILGAASGKFWPVAVQAWVRPATGVAVLFGSLLLAWIWIDHREVEWFVNQRFRDRADQDRILTLAAQRLPLLARWSLLGPWASRSLTINVPNDPVALPEKLALCRRDVGFDPNAVVAYKCAYFFMAAGRHAEGDALLRRAVHHFPSHLPPAVDQLSKIARWYPEVGAIQARFSRAAVSVGVAAHEAKP